MADAPSSCIAFGDSPRISMASSTAPTGCRVSTTLVNAAGRRGRERLISSQPTTWDERANASR